MGRALLANLPTADLESYLRTHELTPVLPRTITDPAAFRAELKKVREEGYALVNQELEEGLVAIAVPVRDRMGRARAAINLSTHIGRKSVEDMRKLVPLVQDAASDIELGAVRPSGRTETRSQSRNPAGKTSPGSRLNWVVPVTQARLEIRGTTAVSSNPAVVACGCARRTSAPSTMPSDSRR
jgi:hypothetical protein